MDCMKMRDDRGMPSPRMRPVFVRPLSTAPVEFYAALDRALAETPARCRGRRFGTGDSGGVILRACDAECRVWSPALYVHIDPAGDGAWQLTGRFSPSSPVWTAFVAIYLTLACGAMAAACYGGAQIIVGETPWAFVGVPIALLLAGFTYGAAFIGQGLGSEDMYVLRTFVEHVADGVPAASRVAAAP